MRRATLLVLTLAALAGCARPIVLPQEDADPVTEWSLEADRVGHGAANWHSIAIMHQAMHDAANAAEPRYARWAAPAPGEPPGSGASVPAAIANAAQTVLVALHPGDEGEIAAVYARALARLPPGPAVERGVTLGRAVGQAAIARRADDGFSRVRPFAAGDAPGTWRSTPPDFSVSKTTDAVPFLFSSRDGPGAQPPPAPLSPQAVAGTAFTYEIGGSVSQKRTREQTRAAQFWAFQSSQRGFLRLAVRLLYSHPLPGGLHQHARVMSQLAAALADGAILTWTEKERFNVWRPITAIRLGAGIKADPAWQPMIETPQHPEYPSGHATDCFVGTGILDQAFAPGTIKTVVYIAPEAEEQAAGHPPEMTMGQHVQAGARPSDRRIFSNFTDAADECANSRVWSGAHFPAARDESKRLADAITARARATVPPLASVTRAGSVPP